MELVTPGIGLIFWTTVTFIILLVILGKFAWKPILNAVKEREETINNALTAAERAKEEVAEMSANNEELLRQARDERDQMMKDAKATKDRIVAEAKGKAQEEGEKMIAAARAAIETEKMAAITEMKNQVATLSIEIAEKIVKEQLSDNEKQKTLVNNLLDEVSMN